jgi:hypothetical protein
MFQLVFYGTAVCVCVTHTNLNNRLTVSALLEEGNLRHRKVVHVLNICQLIRNKVGPETTEFCCGVYMLTQGSISFSVMKQIVNILGFVGHIVTTSQLLIQFTC